MIITSHMQKIIQIYPCLLKLSHKQESVTDGQDRQTDGRYYYIFLYIPLPLSWGDKNPIISKQDQSLYHFIMIKFRCLSDFSLFHLIRSLMKAQILGTFLCEF